MMPISEFDLYKREWLSLVFKNRNQQYGAYELRSHYANVLSTALGVTFFVVAAFGITETILSHCKPIVVQEVYKLTPVDNTIHPMPQRPPTEKQQKAEPSKPAAKTTPVATQRFVAMKPVDDKLAEVVKPLEAGVAVGPADIKAEGKADNIPDIEEPKGVPGGVGGGTEDTEVHDSGGLQILPEPVGGENAWGKFLQKNLRYPAIAQEQNAQGRVFMSFIIEKDGHLSDITIVRKAGYGFDEESMRVLKLAPAWKPGIQNGHPVRVRYTIPINFQMNE